ncbi:hypothetical protein [Epilithonimonas sp.]|uniref:hypothetical protein n=1 Tax=Epilithonimonas sp. TaxID=2894511 RepID=UPI0028A931C0|nr:hypothetical protein [Epilithonimonas sp.]
MKKNLFLLLLLIAFQINAQVLKLNDLKYLVDSNIEKADTYILSKGYDFFENTTQNENCTSILWAYKRNSNNNQSSNFLGKDICSEGFKYIFYQTSSRDIYNLVRDEVKKDGFKFVNQQTGKNGEIKYTYSKNKYEVTMFAGLSNDNRNNYYISMVSKN